MTKAQVKILVIDDDPAVAEVVSMSMKEAGFGTMSATDAESGLQIARTEHPDLIILDLVLPVMSGFEVCKELKRDPVTSAIPVIMLTMRTDEVDRIVGFELGADDYVAKPFHPRELALRCQSILRRIHRHSEDVMVVGQVHLDNTKHEVWVNQKRVNLTSIEFKLLALMMHRKGHAQSRETLLHDVWGYGGEMDTRTIDTHMRRLREKLGSEAERVETVRGIGYKFRDDI